MTSPRVRLVGEEELRIVSSEIEKETLERDEFQREKHDLLEALEDFRRTQGFGRAISAPQIGVNKRMIALNLGDDRYDINAAASFERVTLE